MAACKGAIALRPQSIIRFEQFYLASTALTILLQLLNFAGLIGPDALKETNSELVLVLVAISYALAFVIWFLIARRASNIAKWFFVVITLLGLIGTVPMLAALLSTDVAYALCFAVVTVLNLIALAFLFRRDAAQWLRSRGQVGVIDITTFN